MKPLRQALTRPLSQLERAKAIDGLRVSLAVDHAVSKGQRDGRKFVSDLARDPDYGTLEVLLRLETAVPAWDEEARALDAASKANVKPEYAETYYEAFRIGARDMAAGYDLAREAGAERDGEER